MSLGWIGVDLDGTLAKYDQWQGAEHIGEVIPLMRDRILNWVAEGVKVKIVTARCHDSWAIPFIQQWLIANGMPELEITDKKDFSMWELWDDRAVSVERNTGRCTTEGRV